MTHIGAGLMGPKSEKVEKVLVFKSFLKVQDGPEDASAANNGARKRFWGCFGYKEVTLGHLKTTLESLWSHFGYMRVRFQKQLFSQ